jgi:hypothetical protein
MASMLDQPCMIVSVRLDVAVAEQASKAVTGQNGPFPAASVALGCFTKAGCAIYVNY